MAVTRALSERHARERASGRLTYEQLARHDRRNASAARRARIRARTARLVSRCGLGPGTRALELGCGAGEYTIGLAASGADVTGVDLSAELVGVARERVPSARFIVSDAESLAGVDDATMDCVVGNAALHHFDLGAALASIRRVLKPGGCMGFAEPNMLNPIIFLRKNIPVLKRWVGDTPDETAFVKWRVARAIREAGFVDVEVEPFEFLLPGTPEPLVERVAKVSERLDHQPLVREIAGSLMIFARKPHPR